MVKVLLKLSVINIHHRLQTMTHQRVEHVICFHLVNLTTIFSTFTTKAATGSSGVRGHMLLSFQWEQGRVAVVQEETC